MVAGVRPNIEAGGKASVKRKSLFASRMDFADGSTDLTRLVDRFHETYRFQAL